MWLLLVPAATDFQAKADGAKWRWEPEHASVLYSLMRASTDYTVEVIRKKNTIGDLTIRVLDDGKVLHAFDGHRGTVFATEGGVLYYAEFSPIATGCTVVAVDLKAGKQLWKTRLKGMGPLGHTEYTNSVTLEVEDGAVQIKGKEAGGDYLEYVDLRTGKTVGHRVFRDKTSSFLKK
jgi:hypothetical protein